MADTTALESGRIAGVKAPRETKEIPNTVDTEIRYWFSGTIGQLLLFLLPLFGTCKSMTRRVIFFVLMIASLAANLVFGQNGRFHDMGNLNGNGGFGKTSQALAVSGDGNFVVGDSLATGLSATWTEACLWSKQDPKPIGIGVLAGGTYSSASR